jgi:hypothetical protein
VNFWFLLQLLFNVIFLTGTVGIWVRLNRPPKDDPRLNKGLQLLQSKIAILEDLSDRTEVQVNQLTALLEQKVKDIQNKIQSSEKQISKIDQSMQKSLEVAKIFQDKIPHGEIMDRQNTIKYVNAARLAHQGVSVEEIALQIPELSHGEIDFIAKINRDQLMFCEDSLPEWIENSEPQGGQNQNDSSDLSDVDDMSFMAPLQRDNHSRNSLMDMSSAFDSPRGENNDLKKLGDAFKEACRLEEQQENKAVKETESLPQVQPVAGIAVQNKKEIEIKKAVFNKNYSDVFGHAEVVQGPMKRMDGIVRTVSFPRIDLSRELG